jgi:hypothetical protein
MAMWSAPTTARSWWSVSDKNDDVVGDSEARQTVRHGRHRARSGAGTIGMTVRLERQDTMRKS